jgi:hypothetical protein
MISFWMQRFDKRTSARQLRSAKSGSRQSFRERSNERGSDCPCAAVAESFVGRGFLAE